jgi:uncharacterized membrane protein YdfJ with MMPL/SSD domain
LAILGDKVDSLRLRGRKGVSGLRGHRFWDRISGRVMRRPVVSMMLAVGILVMAAVPYLSINEGFSGVSTLPDEVGSKQAFTIEARDSPEGSGPSGDVIDATSPRR